MRNDSLPAHAALVLRNPPENLVLTIKDRVLRYNLKYPRDKITQTDMVSKIVLDWERRGGQLPPPEAWEKE